MDKLIERGLLYDYYGGLLSEKNRRIYEAAAIDDMSLAEISDEMGISRQAVSETLKRTDDKLRGYEKELQLILKAGRLEEAVTELREAAFGETIDRERLIDIIDRIEEAI